jgi:cyclic beta-1,2-glucan synthetase
MAADVYSVAPHVGRGGWTWYTGSAGWIYRAGVESILGLRVQGEFILLDPCIPAKWSGFEMSLIHRGVTFHITVRNPSGINRGVKDVTLDGEATAAVDQKARIDATRGKSTSCEIVLTLGR